MIDARYIMQSVVTTLEQLKDDVRRELAAKEVNASGRTSAALEVRVVDGKRVELGAFSGEFAPLQTLEIGRPPGKVPRKFADILYKWSLDKGLHFDTDSRRRSFAYLLGRRIAEQGTLRHVNHVDIYSNLTHQTADALNIKLGELIKINLSKAVRG